MKVIKDYKDTYKQLGSEAFIMFYLGEYNMLRHEVYRKWKVPGIMILILVLDKFMGFPSLYMIIPVFEWLLLIVGACCTFLIMFDKWYGALIYAMLMMAYLLGDLGCIFDKIIWAIGAIASILSIFDIKEIDNLKIYFEMAKLTEQDKWQQEEFNSR